MDTIGFPSVFGNPFMIFHFGTNLAAILATDAKKPSTGDKPII
jgi:hypothetical protein